MVRARNTRPRFAGRSAMVESRCGALLTGANAQVSLRTHQVSDHPSQVRIVAIDCAKKKQGATISGVSHSAVYRRSQGLKKRPLAVRATAGAVTWLGALSIAAVRENAAVPFRAGPVLIQRLAEKMKRMGGGATTRRFPMPGWEARTLLPRGVQHQGGRFRCCSSIVPAHGFGRHGRKRHNAGPGRRGTGQ